jgi:MATE family, multidrug efflux pump
MTDPSIADPASPYSPALVARPAPVARPVAARTKLLLEGHIFATLLRLAAPNILNLIAFVAVIIFDGFFLGRIGTDALAGASLAFPWIMLVLQTTNSGMGAGVSSAVARALGAGQHQRADELAYHAFLLALALAAIFSTVMLLAAPFIFGWMGGRDKMLIDALSYAMLPSAAPSASPCLTCSVTQCGERAIWACMPVFWSVACSHTSPSHLC